MAKVKETKKKPVFLIDLLVVQFWWGGESKYYVLSLLSLLSLPELI